MLACVFWEHWRFYVVCQMLPALSVGGWTLQNCLQITTYILWDPQCELLLVQLWLHHARNILCIHPVLDYVKAGGLHQRLFIPLIAINLLFTAPGSCQCFLKLGNIQQRLKWVKSRLWPPSFHAVGESSQIKGSWAKTFTQLDKAITKVPSSYFVGSASCLCLNV